LGGTVADDAPPPLLNVKGGADGLNDAPDAPAPTQPTPQTAATEASGTLSAFLC
jgi:hypothetical protein